MIFLDLWLEFCAVFSFCETLCFFLHWILCTANLYRRKFGRNVYAMKTQELVGDSGELCSIRRLDSAGYIWIG